MKTRLSLSLAAFGLIVLLLATPPQQLAAQSLREQPTPFSAWIDFSAIAAGRKPRLALPIWLESVQRQTQPPRSRNPEKTTFRLRLRRLGGLNHEIQLRLFFEDQPQMNPTVTGWSETGVRLYESEPLGAGLNLPNSEALTISVAGMDYLDVDAPGDGRTLRAAFVTTLRTSKAKHALDFPLPEGAAAPFGGSPAIEPQPDDLHLYGRVKAHLDSGIAQLNPGSNPTHSVEFALDRQPLLAVITFEVLNADPMFPLQLTVNNRPFGGVSLQFPDLADPGYLGAVRPLERDMRFRYTGWVRAQQMIPGSVLQAGLNNLVLQLNRQSGPVAVRSVEIQLKYNWKGLDYQLTP